MSGINGYRWAPSQKAASDAAAMNGTDDVGVYRWEQADYAKEYAKEEAEAEARAQEEKRQADAARAKELERKLAELDMQIAEMAARKQENDFAASRMSRGDYSVYSALMGNRRQAEMAAAQKAENDRIAREAEKANASAAIDEYAKQFRELFPGFGSMTPEEQERAMISAQYLRKKAETLGNKYGLELPDFGAIMAPRTEGPTLDSLLKDIKQKAEAGTLTDADVAEFKKTLNGMKVSYGEGQNAEKEVGGYETSEKRAAREAKEAKAKKRAKLKASIRAKFNKAKVAGDSAGMAAAIGEWDNAGFTEELQ